MSELDPVVASIVEEAVAPLQRLFFRMFYDSELYFRLDMTDWEPLPDVDGWDLPF